MLSHRVRSTILAACALAAPVPAQIFGPQQQLATIPNSVNVVRTADLDGDGDVDVLLSGANFQERISWSENLGGGTFGPPTTITAAVSRPQDLHVADVDGDGDPDLLSASFFDDKVAWYANDGTGSFGAQQVLSLSTDGALSVHTADLDGDGDPDVVAAARFGNEIVTFENLGGGSFGPKVVVSSGSAIDPTDVLPSDLDGDGDPDLVVSEFNSGQIAWYENMGSGSFGPERVISTHASGAVNVDAADLDGDGDVDVLSASSSNNTVAWYENLGGGSFGPQQVLSAAAIGAAAVAAEDLNGDGNPDVLFASSGDDTVAWFENLGAASFGPQQRISIQVDTAVDVTAADLDGDGDPDVLAAAPGNREAVWFEHQGLGAPFCRPAAMNGAGLVGKIAARGSTTVTNNALSLEASDLPPSNFAVFLTSPNEAVAVRPPNSVGNLCLGAPIGRYVGPGQIQPTGPQGFAALRIDLGRTPTPTGFVQIQPGETWSFQCWYRDSVLGMATSNLTDGVSVEFR
ncbi:MAG: VCBS repeat-containing protein [Planctomycetota bacterium]